MTTMENRKKLIEEIDRALSEVSRARLEDWHLADGQSAAKQLALLEERLIRARAELSSDSAHNDVDLRQLVRWVADWIPDLDDPLLKAVGRVERIAAR